MKETIDIQGSQEVSEELMNHEIISEVREKIEDLDLGEIPEVLHFQEVFTEEDN